MAINLRRVAVEVFGEVMLMHGVIESSRRLTDLANEAEPFLILDQIETHPYAGEAIIGLERHSRGLINKDSIVMLAERDADAPQHPSSADMRVPKTPTRILIYTNHFAINADIHLPVGGELRHFLESSPGQFVPLTNATATPMEAGTRLTSFRRHFMLINRDHISFFGQADALPTGSSSVAGETIG